MNKRDLRRARILGAALRTAHMISVGRPGIIPHTPLSYEDGRLVLNIPPAYAALDGERLRAPFRVACRSARHDGEVSFRT